MLMLALTNDSGRRDHDICHSPHKGASPDQVLKHLQLSRRSKRCTGSAGLFGPQQSRVPEPRFPRPRSCAVVYLPPSPARGSADTQGHAAEQWAMLGTTGSVTSSVHPCSGRSCASLLGILEENRLESCVKTASLSRCPFPQDMMGEVPCLFTEPMLGVLCSARLEAQDKGQP